MNSSMPKVSGSEPTPDPWVPVYLDENCEFSGTAAYPDSFRCALKKENPPFWSAHREHEIGARGGLGANSSHDATSLQK